MAQETHYKTTNRTSKFVKDVGIYAIGNLGSKAITFFMVPLYTYFVEQPSEYGYYDLCLTAIFLLLPFVTLQLRDGSFRFLLDTEKVVERSKIITSTYCTLIVTMSVVLLLMPLLSFQFHIAYLWWSFALLVAMSLQEVVSQVVRGLGDNKMFVTIGIVSSFGIGVFSVIFVAWLGMGIKGIFLANILARVLALCIAEAKLHTIARYFKPHQPFKRTLKELLRYTLPLLPGSICWWITGSSDRWFISNYIGLEANGIYAVAFRFTSILTTIALIFYQAWQETAILQYHSPDRDSFFSKMLNNYIYLLSGLVVTFCFALKLNYFWLCDANYQASINYVYPMALSTMIFAIAAFFDMGYQCAKDTKRTLPAIIVSAVVNLSLNFLLINTLPMQWKVYGVIITSLVTYTVLVAYRWHDMKRYLKLSIYRGTALPVVIALAGVAPFYLSTNWILDLVILSVAILLLVKSAPETLRKEVSEKFLKKIKPGMQ